MFANLFVVLLAARLRYAGEALAYASPVTAGSDVWLCGILSAAGLAALAATLGRRTLRNAGARRALLQLLIFPAFFAYEWTFLPARMRHWRIIDWAVLGALLAVIAVLLWRDRRPLAERGLTTRNFAPAAGMLAVPTLVMMAVPVVVACFVGTDFQPARAACLLAYPLYALAQLAIFQVFLVPRLVSISKSRISVVVVSAGIFTLLHWPNGLLMGACAAGATVWTIVYLYRPNVYALALSMGLMAAVLAGALPRERTAWRTHNLRTGPIYVERHLGRQVGSPPRAQRPQRR